MCGAVDAAMQTDPALQSYVHDAGDGATAVIPVGSTEQHGPHLPVSVDSVIAREIAHMVSEKNRYVLLPTITYGVSHEHSPLFNISVGADLLCSMIAAICASARANGLRNVIVINGHHGNIGALDRTLGATSSGRHCGIFEVFHYWRYMKGHALGHAGFAETSMMLAISEKSVRMDLAQAGLATDGMPPSELKRLSELAAKSFVKATGNGIWGDPRGATAEAGRRMICDAADEIAKECKRLIHAGA